MMVVLPLISMISPTLEATARADLTKNIHPVCCIPSNHPTFVIVVVVIPIPVVPLDVALDVVEMFEPCWFPKAREETNELISATVEGEQTENLNCCWMEERDEELEEGEEEENDDNDDGGEEAGEERKSNSDCESFPERDG